MRVVAAATASFVLAMTGMGSLGPATSTAASVPPSRALGIAVFQPTAQFQNYQSAVSRLPSFVEWFQSWPNGGAGKGAPLYSATQERFATAHHLVPIISWGTGDISLSSIVHGREDATVLAPAAALARVYPGTLYLRLDWEMNGSWASWNPRNSDQARLKEAPSTFVAMWDHVVKYFRAAGVTNVKWVWAPNVDGGNGTMAAYYPGDRYVDYVGLDGYNFAYTDKATWMTPAQLFGASYAELEAITSKPVIITETSSVEANKTEAAEGLSKAKWIEQLNAYLATLGNLVGMCWFDQPATVDGYGVVDFSVNTSPDSLAAWEHYFVNNPGYQGALPVK